MRVIEFMQSRQDKRIWINPERVMSLVEAIHPHTGEVDTMIRLAEGGSGGSTVYVKGCPAAAALKMTGETG